MMQVKRRTILSGIGMVLPFVLGPRQSALAAEIKPTIRLQPFDEAVRAALSGPSGSEVICRRIEVGDSELVRAGLQGCQNDRPFAGFPTGALRIVRTGFGPGPSRAGIRLYIATVDVALASTIPGEAPGRPLDFALVPPAPTFG